MERKLKGIVRNILLVSASRGDREEVRRVLKDSYVFVEAESGKEALEILGKEEIPFSLVISSYPLPDVGWDALLSCISEKGGGSGIPVLALTNDEDEGSKSVAEGALDYVNLAGGSGALLSFLAGQVIELYYNRWIINTAGYDSITGLYTKHFFLATAEEYERLHPDWDMDVVVAGINHFPLVSTIYGKDFADQALRDAADAVRDVLKEKPGLACRTDEDLFYIFCRRLDNLEDLRDRIRMGMPGLKENQWTRVRIGAYTGASGEENLRARFEAARQACLEIKDSYSETIAVFDEKRRSDRQYNERLMGDIQKALDEKQLKVYFQPVYEIYDGGRTLQSVEALIRWQHPEMGMIRPNRFIPLFEKSARIQDLDLYVWRQVASLIKGWREAYGVSVPVSINISRSDFYDPDLEHMLLEVLDEYDISPRDFILEIKETSFADNTLQMIDVVRRLKSRGFRIEMDDFDCGYLSLNTLSMLPIDVIKFDMNSFHNAFTERNQIRLIRIFMGVAEYLSLPSVVQGVERERMCQLLLQEGCTTMQGYYFSKPVTAMDFEEELKAAAASQGQALSPSDAAR